MVSRCSRGVCPLQGRYPSDALRGCPIPASARVAPHRTRRCSAGKSRPVPPKVHRAAAHSAWPGPRKASCRAPCTRKHRRKKPEDASLLSLRTPLTANPVWHWRASKLQSTKGSGQVASAPNHSRRRVMADRAALIPPQRPERCCGIVIVGSPTSGQIVLMDHTQLVSESSEPS
jgi:hypothetical protein